MARPSRGKRRSRHRSPRKRSRSTTASVSKGRRSFRGDNTKKHNIAPTNFVRFVKPSVDGTLTFKENFAVVETVIGTFKVGLPSINHALRMLFDESHNVLKLNLSNPPFLREGNAVILDGLNRSAVYNRMHGVIGSVNENDTVDVKLEPAHKQAFTMQFAGLLGPHPKLKNELRVHKSNVFYFPTKVKVDLSLLLGKVTSEAPFNVTLELDSWNPDHTIDAETLEESTFEGRVARAQVQIVSRSGALPQVQLPRLHVVRVVY